MILCDKNAFVLAMDSRGGGEGGFCLSFCSSCYLSCNTVNTAVKISYAISQVTGNDYNCIKIQIYR